MAQLIADPPKKQALIDDINKLFSQPDEWTDTPHELLGGRSPADLLDSAEGRIILRDLLEAIKLGLTT